MGEVKIEEKETEDEINWMEDDKDSEGEGEENEEDKEEGDEEEDSKKDGDKESKDEGEKKEGAEDGGKDETKYSPEEEIRELRSLLRTSKRQMSVMDAQLKRTNAKTDKALAAVNSEEDEDGNLINKTEKEELSNIEKLQQNLDIIGSERGPILEILAETMAQNSKYSDIREVCSRANFDDVFDVVASEMAKDGKGDKEELLLKVEADVWTMTNPYKYMYEFIKSNHPKYSKTENKNEDKTVSKKGDTKKTMDSLANTDGGGGDKTAGWTTARIDALSEDELDKVPIAIYEKYINDDLK